MMAWLVIIALFFQPPAPLAVNAYIAGGTLVVTVFSDQPTSAQIRVSLPPGWSADSPLTVNIGVSAPVVHIWRVSGPGLGLIRVVVSDARGNVVRATAYGEGPRPPAGPAQGVWRVWVALIRT